MTAPVRTTPVLSTAFAQVVAPVDFSSLSWTSVSAATAFARGLGIPCRVVHVDTSAPWLDRLPGDLTLHAAPNGQRVRVEVIEAATAADGIADLLASSEPSLLVMASHGHTAAATLALGSTAEDVLRRWSGPIVLTGPRYRVARPLVSRIVVALPPLAEVPVVLADDVRALADRFGVPVQVATVMDVASISYDYGLRRDQLLHLNDRAGKIGAEPVPLHGSRTAHELVSYADAQPGTVLAMVPRVKSTAAQLLLGSVSKAVLRHTVSPVLLRRV